MEAFWAALPPTLVAFTGLIVGILQFARSGANRLAAKQENADIHALVNSQLSAVKADLSIANHRINELVMIIESHKKRGEDGTG